MEAYALPRGYKAVVYSHHDGYEVVLYNEENDAISTTHHTRVAFRELRDAMETRHPPPWHVDGCASRCRSTRWSARYRLLDEREWCTVEVYREASRHAVA